MEKLLKRFNLLNVVNSVADITWNSVKLFILKNGAAIAGKNVPLTVQNLKMYLVTVKVNIICDALRNLVLFVRFKKFCCSIRCRVYLTAIFP